jgi:hypothetical protein
MVESSQATQPNQIVNESTYNMAIILVIVLYLLFLNIQFDSNENAFYCVSLQVIIKQ